MLESFVGSLNPGTRAFVKAFKPKNIESEVEYARLEEESLNLNSYKTTKSAHTFTKNFNHIPSPPNTNTKPPLLPTAQTKSLNLPKIYPINIKPNKYIPPDV